MDNAQKKSICDILDRDCLRIIFSFLKVDDRAKVEQVCECWKSVSRQSLKEYFRKKPSLEIGTDTNFFPSPNYTPRTNLKLFKEIIRYCNVGIEELSFARYCAVSTIGFVPEIVQYCTNVKRLYLENLQLCSIDVLALTESALPQLVLLSFGKMIDVLDVELRIMFRGRKTLESLSIICGTWLLDYHLKYLNSAHLKRLEIRDCDSFRMTHIASVKNTLTDLTIVFSKCYPKINYHFENIAQLSKLRKLTLRIPEEIDLALIIQSISLRCLQLEDVELGYWTGPSKTNYELDAIVELPNLRRLEMHDVALITSEMFMDREECQLRIVTLPCCNIRDIAELCEHLPMLTDLTVCSCVVVPNDVPRHVTITKLSRSNCRTRGRLYAVCQ